MHNSHGILGQLCFWVTVGCRGGMETVWSAWLFAAGLPSASQGCSGARTRWGVVAVAENVGTATEAWIRGTRPCCCRLHIPGSSWGWLLVLGREVCSCSKAPQRFGPGCFAECVPVADMMVPHRKRLGRPSVPGAAAQEEVTMNSHLQTLGSKVVGLCRQWSKSCVVQLAAGHCQPLWRSHGPQAKPHP